MRVPITTTIDKEQYDLIKKNRWRLNDLVDLGCGAKANFDSQQEKIKGYELTQGELLKTVKQMKTRLSWLEAMQKETEADDENKRTE